MRQCKVKVRSDKGEREGSGLERHLCGVVAGRDQDEEGEANEHDPRLHVVRLMAEVTYTWVCMHAMHGDLVSNQGEYACIPSPR